METNLKTFEDFKQNKVQTLTLEQLQRTHEENDVYGKPLKGIHHYQLLNELQTLCANHNYKTEIYDLFAAQNNDKAAPGVVLLPQVEAVKGANAIEAHILRRIFANIRLTDFDDKDNTTCLAVAFHQKGIEIGFGNNVKVCHNQTMLGKSQYIRTYGNRDSEDKKIDIPKVLATVNGWLDDAEVRIKAERKTMKKLRETVVDAQTCFIIIGMLTAMRVKADSKNPALRENITYPLSNTQINSFTESLLLKYKENERVTAWDIYDTATNLYKPTAMEIPNIMQQNVAMANFLVDHFAIN